MGRRRHSNVAPASRRFYGYYRRPAGFNVAPASRRFNRRDGESTFSHKRSRAEQERLAKGITWTH